MANLLGDLWQAGEPNWNAALPDPAIKLRLYGERDAKPGRKMGHFTALANTPEEEARTAIAARPALLRQ